MSGTAVHTGSAGDLRFKAHPVSLLKSRDASPRLNNGSGTLVAEDEGEVKGLALSHAGLKKVGIRTAHADVFHLQHNFSGPRGRDRKLPNLHLLHRRHIGGPIYHAHAVSPS